MARNATIRFGIQAVFVFLFLSCLTVNGQTTATSKKPVKVFILAGQSNMEGKAKISLLKHQMMQPETAALFAHLHKDGEFIERDDVFIKFLDRSGKLTVGYGSPNRIGPELQFGFVIGDYFEQPVLLIKTAWGGKSLYRDFRSPNAGEPVIAILEKQLASAKKKKPETTMDDIKKSYGFYYRAMLEEVENTLQHIDQFVPGYSDDQGYELAGLVWFQGWNDMVNPDFVAAYTDNMAHFIRDVRRDLKQPKLPVVVGVLGVGGTNPEKPNARKDQFKVNQAAVGVMPEFAGNVAVVHTDRLWDQEADAVFRSGWKEHKQEWEAIGSDRPYHYLGSIKCYNRMGGAFAQAMINLQSEGDKAVTPENFKTENLVAWCIVPFDAKNRGPAQRAEMVRRLGLTRVAYDWREKHIPEFEQEILEYKKRDIEYFAFWGWHDSMEALIKKHAIKPQIWQMYRGQQPKGTQEEKVKLASEQFLPLVEKTRSLGLKLGIYNHGGWAGEPENMIAVCENLRKNHNGQHVGIVYNFHHGHADVSGFDETIKQLKPYLICLNINGMAKPETVQRNTHNNQILPVGSGVHEREMIRAVIASGYDGPIGVLGHRAEMDAEDSVGLNLKGLKEIFDSAGHPKN